MNTEIAAAEIMAVMDRVCSQQVEKLFMVGAFYLGSALLPVIAPHLEADDPPAEDNSFIVKGKLPTDAIGRYRTHPVLPKDSNDGADLPRRSEEFVDYTFWPLLAAD